MTLQRQAEAEAGGGNRIGPPSDGHTQTKAAKFEDDTVQKAENSSRSEKQISDGWPIGSHFRVLAFGLVRPLQPLCSLSLPMHPLPLLCTPPLYRSPGLLMRLVLTSTMYRPQTPISVPPFSIAHACVPTRACDDL